MALEQFDEFAMIRTSPKSEWDVAPEQMAQFEEELEARGFDYTSHL